MGEQHNSPDDFLIHRPADACGVSLKLIVQVNWNAKLNLGEAFSTAFGLAGHNVYMDRAAVLDKTHGVTYLRVMHRNTVQTNRNAV